MPVRLSNGYIYDGATDSFFEADDTRAPVVAPDKPAAEPVRIKTRSRPTIEFSNGSTYNPNNGKFSTAIQNNAYKMPWKKSLDKIYKDPPPPREADRPEGVFVLTKGISERDLRVLYGRIVYGGAA